MSYLDDEKRDLYRTWAILDRKARHARAEANRILNDPGASNEECREAEERAEAALSVAMEGRNGGDALEERIIGRVGIPGRRTS